MTTRYNLVFMISAQKEWNKLAEPIRYQFYKKLTKILQHPRIPSAKLHDMKDCYKIKLRKEGYRLVYRVLDAVVVVEIIAVGRRDGAVYEDAHKRVQ